MNVIKIQGGLGNQMFQFAFGIYLNQEFGLNISYDLSFFNNQKEYILCGNDRRDFDLIKVFPEVGRYLNDHNLAVSLTDHYLVNRILKRCGLICLNAKVYSYRRDPQTRLKTFLKSAIGSDIYFEGYWQNRFYVEPVAGILRNLFYTNIPDVFDNVTLGQIKSSESVSIHIRRGDYLNSKIFRSMGVEYLCSSIELILSKVKNPTFFLFTDDIKWAKLVLSEIKLQYPEIDLVDNNSGIEDLLLMSFCKHNIICNSTYSWWASFLNENPSKITISPGNWTYDETWNNYIKSALLSGILILEND